MLKYVNKLTDNIKVIKLIYRFPQLSKHLLFDENPIKSLIDSFVIEGLYVTEVGLDEMEVSLLCEEINCPVVVES